MTPVEFKELAKWPYLDMPYATIKDKFGGPIAALMDKLASSSSKSETKLLKPKDITWRLIHKRCDDPDRITDQKAFLAYLVANSEYALKASCRDGWKGYERLSVCPDQFRSQYEQRAMDICNERLREKAAKEKPEVEEVIAIPQNGHIDLLGTFDDWCRSHTYDKRIASIARLALLKLVE